MDRNAKTLTFDVESIIFMEMWHLHNNWHKERRWQQHETEKADYNDELDTSQR